jgi:Nucleotidyl transferase AbiEii toxin, Type IV TA system
VKAGILLEAGFDQVTPNRPCLISSWAYEIAASSNLPQLTDNRAIDVPCYEPGYTLVEKLQTISTKFRRQRNTGEMPHNFLRHYCDVYCLLDDPDIQAFIGCEAYHAHKDARFPKADEKRLDRNEAFLLSDPVTRSRFEAAYRSTSALYYREQPPLAALLERLATHLHRL